MIVEQVLGFVAFGVFMLVFLLLIVDSVSRRLSTKKLSDNFGQALVDNAILREKLQEVAKSKDNQAVEQTEGFLKFVSESRDWAFGYIEEVQAAISGFEKRVGPIVKNYKDTGKVSQIKPTELVKELSDAYDILMSAMPEDQESKA
jgi:hypothetical protein